MEHTGRAFGLSLFPRSGVQRVFTKRTDESVDVFVKRLKGSIIDCDYSDFSWLKEKGEGEVVPLSETSAAFEESV